ncbi:MAG: patatin-like phospholipase family protein [Saprospiraceae bacterium]|nr:patatin-like phospholipase family protein [Saprospiraceae bacterium]
MAKKTALILSGGGAKGAFQVGAEKYAREVKGYHWDIIAGVSVGALNGAMLAMQKVARLWEIWNTISDEKVYTGGLNVGSAIKLLFGAKSFYGNQPLYKLLKKELEVDKITTDLLIGSVSLVSGEYVRFNKQSPHLAEAILASTVMPMIWTPVDIDSNYLSMVDGGVRNVSPVGDVLDADPDEIVVINCGAEAADPLAGPPKDIVRIGLRTLDILLNELFVSDMREFIRTNDLVKQAAAHGLTLIGSHGQPLKYFDCKIIEPVAPLGDTLDFSQAAVQSSLSAGEERAHQVLGK